LATAVPVTRVTSAGEIPGIPGGNSSPDWNNLTQDIIAANSVNIFKSRLDKFTRPPCAVERDVLSGWGSTRPRRVRPTKELFVMIPMHMMNREIIPGR